MVTQLRPLWGGSLPDEVRDGVVKVLSVIDALKDDGTPNWLTLKEQVAQSFLREPVQNLGEINDKGRTDDWLLSVIVDDEVLTNVGEELPEEVLEYISRTVLGAFSPGAPNGYGQKFAARHGYVLCEWKIGGLKHRYFTSDAATIRKTYMEVYANGMRKRILLARDQMKVATDVCPELEPAVPELMLNMARSGFNEFPAAKVGVQALNGGNGKG